MAVRRSGMVELQRALLKECIRQDRRFQSYIPTGRERFFELPHVYCFNIFSSKWVTSEESGRAARKHYLSSALTRMISICLNAIRYTSLSQWVWSNWVQDTSASSTNASSVCWFDWVISSKISQCTSKMNFTT